MSTGALQSVLNWIHRVRSFVKKIGDGIDRTKKWHRKFAGCLAVLLLLAGLVSGCQNGKEAENLPLSVYFYGCSEDADAILLHVDDTDVIIDTGVYQDSERLVEQMEENGVSQIDLMILTHPDKDHIGGAAKILDRFPVDQVIQTDAKKGSDLQGELEARLKTEQVTVPTEVQQYTYGALALTVYPPKEAEYENTNNYSIAVLAEYDGRRIFFAGDAKKKRIKELLEEKLPQVDVYKCTHHGRDEGKGTDLIAKLHPDVAVVTAGAPEEETKRALKTVGAQVYTTLETDVVVEVTEEEINVRTVPVS